jgi:hypothetical protein
MRPSARSLLVIPFALLLPAIPLDAQDSAVVRPPRDSTPRILQPLTVIGRADDLVGVAATASQGHVGAVDLRTRPLAREGEILETVPGFIATQHSGDGKANQYFVRGFNLDHGTDFQTRIEGMPVNMATHAHGQGYTDLNFLIPEVVEYLDYRLGVYHAEMGDFGSAGGAELFLSKRQRPFAVATGGANGLARVATGGSVRSGPGDLLLAAEIKRYDGPWVLEQDLRKYSGVARYSWERGASEFSLLGLAYHNRWNSSDQIPARAVQSGLIPRFGTLDDSDGGRSQRYSLSGSWRHLGGSSLQEVQVFGIYSDLSLYSNFAFFLDDTTRGDQFNQRENRVVVGASLRHTQPVQALGRDHVLKLGLQTRADFISDIGLHRTQRRQRIGTVRQDDVRQWGSGLYAELESRWRPWLRTVAGGRVDAYAFRVDGDIPANSGRRSAGILSPKASLVLSPSARAEFYLSAGLGFHSNDARGTTITMDPVDGGPAERVDPLVRSRGAEVGARISPVAGWRSTLSLWALALDSELLFVGDGGATEPSFESHRRGVTWANFFRPIPQLAFDLDLSLARARFAGVPGSVDRIPGALENVVAAGVTWIALERGPLASLRLRRFGAYSLIEDNRVRAKASTLVNAEIGYRLAGVRLEASVLNLFDSRDRDIQYYYASRFQGEPAGGVDDVHFHPVEPRQVRISLGWGI